MNAIPQTHTNHTDVAMCADCLIFYVNGDLSSLDFFYSPADANYRAAKIRRGVTKHLRDLMIGVPTSEGYLGECHTCGITAQVADYQATAIR